MSDTPEKTLSDRHVLKGTLFRRHGSRIQFTEAPPAAVTTPAPVRRPARVAEMLALAHHLQSAIDRGHVSDRAAVARKLGLTRARVTQLLDLLLLAPQLQVAVLESEAVDGVEPICERDLRAVTGVRDWQGQADRWRRATGGIEGPAV